MERVPLWSTDTSAGLWVSPVTSLVGGWGRRTQSTGEGGLRVSETAGCQGLCVCVCVWTAHVKMLWWTLFSSIRTPSPADFNRRRACGLELGDIHDIHGQNTPSTQAELMGQGCLTPRGQLGSRPHTPVGRVDIRPHDDSVMGQQILYYTPASPKLEYNVTPSSPVTERWQNLNKVSVAT